MVEETEPRNIFSDVFGLGERSPKPRGGGLTIAIDRGISVINFCDVIDSNHVWIDIVKFGWGTAAVTPRIREKIAKLREAGIPFFFGGTLFERLHKRGQTEAYLGVCIELGAKYVELSCGSSDVESQQICEIAGRAVERGLEPIIEIGKKDQETSIRMPPSVWIEEVRRAHAAKASLIILEGRESGSSGIYRSSGEPRFGLIDEIVKCGVPADLLVFEAPKKDAQAYLIKSIGPEVNLCNIAFDDVIALETLRQGLRFDTFDDFA